jgi:hypothetical protein
MAEERKRILAERFSKREKSEERITHQGREKSKVVDRRRHSLYLDQALVARVDRVYKGVAHELYPAEIDKADFMEALLAFSLEHLDQIKLMLIPQQGKE